MRKDFSMDQKIELDGVHCTKCGGVFLKLTYEKDLKGRDRCRADCEACGRYIKFVPLPTSKVVMPFGKYKGWKITDIPIDYIQWALQNMTSLNPSLRNHFESLVNR